MKGIQIFVYGTLKPGESNHTICAPYITASQPAIAAGGLFHLLFNYPVMTTEVAGTVRGWQLTLAEPSVLTLLDEFEQHDPDVFQHIMPGLVLADHQYCRVKLPLFTPERSPIGTAWAYIMTLAQIRRLNGQPIPGGCWNGLPASDRKH